MMDDFHRPRKKYAAFRQYYRAYGGWRELLNSPYFALAILLTGILWPLALPGDENPPVWTEFSLSALPAMLGFSLGALAILISLGQGSKVPQLFRVRGPASYYLKVNATFFHFILIQFLALIFSLLNVAYSSIWLSFLGLFFVNYSILSGLAAAAIVFGSSRIHDAAGRDRTEE